jgi:hypothetical protein
VAIIVQTLLLQRALAAKLPAMKFVELWRSLAKVGVATLAMSAVVAGGWWLLQRQDGEDKLTDLLAIFGLIPLGVAVYAVTVLALKIEGREELQGVWKKIRARV